MHLHKVFFKYELKVTTSVTETDMVPDMDAFFTAYHKLAFYWHFQ